MSKLLHSRAAARLRMIMRGYRVLKKTGRLDIISEVKTELTRTVISKCQSRVNRHIFGAGFYNAELIIRQYLLIRIAGQGLNKAILYSVGEGGSRIIYPLPIEWQKILREKGLNVAIIRSSLIWYGYCLLLYFYGVMSFLKVFSQQLIVCFQCEKERKLGRYTYFNTLTEGNVPQEVSDGQSHDVISWYYENIGKENNIECLCHSVKGVSRRLLEKTPVIYLSAPVPFVCDFRQMLLFLMSGLSAIVVAFIDLLRGRWWHAIILHESIMAIRVRLQDNESIAQDYMFHNSNWIYRPLWTYEVEKLGARILFYFYSTNVEPFLKSDGTKNITYGWQASNWPNILVWDEGQANFIRNDVGNLVAKISIVEQIWFSASKDRLKPLPIKTIAIFDVQPVRDSFYQTLGLDFEYYVPSIAKQFLLDIYTVLNVNNITMALKRKRKVGNLAHPKYRYFLESLESKPHYVSIDPGVAASHVIDECFAVISVPYTSTALLAREQGKPSVYYDPFSQCQKGDPAAHGIAILSGKKELEEWISCLVETM
jgi:polysaccharide biosynthesis PFTS motif protein